MDAICHLFPTFINRFHQTENASTDAFQNAEFDLNTEHPPRHPAGIFTLS